MKAHDWIGAGLLAVALGGLAFGQDASGGDAPEPERVAPADEPEPERVTPAQPPKLPLQSGSSEPAPEADSPEALREALKRLEGRLEALESAKKSGEDEAGAPGVLRSIWNSLEVHGVGVASYGQNTIDPDQRKNANAFRVSDLDHDSFSPNFFKLGIQRPLSGENEFDAGLRIEVAAGSTVEDHLSLDPDFLGGEEINLANAYVEVQIPTPLNALVVRFGRAYGWFGLDSVDLYDAPLFSMSWFGNYTPFTNTGLFLEMELAKGLTLMQYVGNGSEFVVDNNDAKSLGGRLAYSSDSLTVAFNWIWGPERNDNVHDNRWQLELDVAWQPLEATGLYLMLHLGQEEGQAMNGGTAKFGGGSLAIRQGVLGGCDSGHAGELDDVIGASRTYQRLTLLARASYYRDQGGANTGIDQTLQELTGGVELKPTSFSWVRLEYRHDFSNQPNAFLGHRGQTTRRHMGTIYLAIGVGF